MSYNANQNPLKLLKRTYAEKTRRTIFFVGAGASAESGLPTWYDLRETVHQEIDSVVDSNSDDSILENFRELEVRRKNGDYWGYFEYAEEHWRTTYNDALTKRLDIDYSKIPLPVIYEKLWSMKNVRQIITLNVDGLIENAFQASATTRKAKLLTYDGYAVTDSQAFIAKDAYCCLNLHGTVYQKSRWIMSGAERRRLNTGIAGTKYKAFLTWLFQSHNVVFVGINPEDIAISPAIIEAEKSGILGSHFWICPSPSTQTKQWAEKHGVRLICYQPEVIEDGIKIHSGTICSILDDLEQYSAPEPEVELPITRHEVDPKEIPDGTELLKLIYTDRSKVVELLTGAATYLGRKHDFTGSQLDDFIKKNSLGLQIITALDSKVPNHDLIGHYKLHEKLQGSGSSSVWLAEDTLKSNEYVVVKVLNGNTHEDETERQSFRRGIESMYLLNGSNSSIAPRYIDHLELPLAVIMEHITGSSLSEVVATGEFREPEDTLKIFLSIAQAVRSCHVSDGQVLHRDLKPGNIIFENWFPGYEKSQLIEASSRLINFDLSWHRFSSGNTKAISAEESGYYAPEQKGLKNTAPPRSASTDAYMLGMILYYLVCFEHPPEGGARLIDWVDLVDRVVKRRFKDVTVSNRVTRLIEMMTRREMQDRLDIEAAQAEVESLLDFMKGNYQKVDHDVFVENLIVTSGRKYVWNTDKIEGKVSTSLQADFIVRYQPKGMKCEIEFTRSRGDGDNRGSFGQRINLKIQEATQSLRDAGWVCETSGAVIRSLKASIKITDLIAKPDLGASLMVNVSNRLLANFD